MNLTKMHSMYRFHCFSDLLLILQKTRMNENGILYLDKHMYDYDARVQVSQTGGGGGEGGGSSSTI